MSFYAKIKAFPLKITEKQIQCQINNAIFLFITLHSNQKGNTITRIMKGQEYFYDRK